jgi:hypothetical protein
MEEREENCGGAGQVVVVDAADELPRVRDGVSGWEIFAATYIGAVHPPMLV